MLSLVLFLLVIIGLTLFLCIRFDRTFEEAIPLSAFGIILILFLFGLINALKVGLFVICIGSAVAFIYTVIWCFRNRVNIDLKKTSLNLFTPATAVFAVFAVLLAYWNKGRYAMLTDEFSHWLDTVVIMTRIDDFGTAAGSTAVFPSYPPAMSLFQYLLEKICMFTGEGFVEWKAYYAYQLLVIIVLLPFISVRDGIVKKIAGVILWLPALIVPLFFFGQSFNSLYIDPFLGILGGCGFARIALSKKKDVSYVVYLTMLTAVLTLAKDVGIYLALFVGLYFVIDTVSKNRIIAVLPLASTAIAKMLWNLELTLSQAERKFSAPFDVKGVIDTLKGNGNEFYTTVYENFKEAITYRYIYYERIGLNYVGIMFFMTVAIILLMANLYKRQRLTKASAVAGAIIPSVAIIFYILSMFPLYVSRFAEDEARDLASFDRYCGIMFLTGTLLLVFMLRDYILQINNRLVLIIVAILMLMSVKHSQNNALNYYFSKQSVTDSENYRSAINILSAQINANTDEEARILLVGEDEDIPFHPILETISKPRKITYSDVYITEAVGASGISAEEFEGIIYENFDYVAVYRVTDNLIENYSGIFEDIGSLHNLALYEVEPEGRLRIIE
ncbi:MAG: hypothetical protein IKP29_03610 [Pseudobutyrivibrio sp.]|nr:hypothetical protein [Pseudobutyrivibrio sp.]